MVRVVDPGPYVVRIRFALSLAFLLRSAISSDTLHALVECHSCSTRTTNATAPVRVLVELQRGRTPLGESINRRTGSFVEQASRVANLYPNALAHEEYRWNSIDEAIATNLSSGIHTLRLVPFMQYSKDTSYMQGLSADEQDLIERSIFIRDVELEKATPRALPGAIEAESHRRFGEPFSTLSRLAVPPPGSDRLDKRGCLQTPAQGAIRSGRLSCTRGTLWTMRPLLQQ